VLVMTGGSPPSENRATVGARAGRLSRSTTTTTTTTTQEGWRR
jgi:hypothetical protein